MFDVYRFPFEEDDSVEMLSQLEAVCETILSLASSDTIGFRDKWPVDQHTKEVDYTAAFLDMNHVCYTKHKLEGSSMRHNTGYLTGLLRRYLKVCSQPSRETAQTVSLLVNLGADVNGTMGPNVCSSWVDHTYTIWRRILRMLPYASTGKDDVALWGHALKVCLQAGADPTLPLPYHISQPEADWWFSNRRPPMSQQYDRVIICEWTARELLAMSIWKETLCHLLSEVGATGSSKQIIVLGPKEPWRVIPRHFLDTWLEDEACYFPTIGKPKHRHRFPYIEHRHRFPYIGVGPTPRYTLMTGQIDRLLTVSEAEQTYFEDGLDALHAAGWSDEEIRGLPPLPGISLGN
ncbi:hypothetical protein A1O1_00535 [Capronia coronata CBS 617.96]|uniref:Uncharacterized protein n=1 Tax=Capronia coronata CBS 617.96 TaxID=1182541 RepID=W9ZLQ9_9EURO|nr:uncharacterized protein A1O1_00535 [Capronia coronata CBS 617.96]EXJ95414.1 hypothetical protein A1O1_00535 [Capronia coronata CBS 617.96]